MKNITHLRRWLGISAAILPLALLSSAASAGIIDAGFGIMGTYSLVGSCGTSCASVSLEGTADLRGLDSFFGGSGTPAFTFSALLDVAPDGVGVAASGTPPAAGWQLEDAAGDSLYGSVNGWLIAGLGGGGGQLNFDITGGAGLFDNISSGSGTAWVAGGKSGFYGLGELLLGDPSSGSPSVPEPGTLLLFATALTALGCWSTVRRRSAPTKRLGATL